MTNAFLHQNLKRWLLAAAVLLVIATTCMPWSGHNAHAEDVLRLHILANSDSAEDQRVKLLVRDQIIRSLPATDSAAETEAYLLSHGAEILALVESILHENGCDYGAQLMLGVYEFPDRDYDGKLYPAGDYNALRILLGSGQGQNWWCVLFPPLCIVTVDEEPLPETDDIEFESSIAKWIRSWREES